MTDTDWTVDISLLGGRSPWNVLAELIAHITIGSFVYIVAAATIDWLGLPTAVALFVAIAVASKSTVNFGIDDTSPSE